MRILIGCTLLLGALFATSAHARPPGPPPLHKVLLEQADDLGITADQAAAIEALADDMQDSARDAHEAMRSARQSGDDAAIEAARADLEDVRATFEGELEGILGAESWERIQAELPPPPPRGEKGDCPKGPPSDADIPA